LTLQHNQLLVKQGVFGNELGLAAREVCKGTAYPMWFGRPEALFDRSFKSNDNAADCLMDG